MTNGSPTGCIPAGLEVTELGLVQMEDSRDGQHLSVFIQDPVTEQQSLSGLEDVEEEWEQLDPTSEILEAVNSKEFIGDALEKSAPPGLAVKEPLESQMQAYQAFDYYGYGHEPTDSQEMYGFPWQAMPGYPYFDQWQAATNNFISAFGYYDFGMPLKTRKGRGQGKQVDMSSLWSSEAGPVSSQDKRLTGVDASDPSHIVWTLEKASLTSKNKDREKVSPSFRIPMGGQEVEFKLNLFATSVSSNRHCSSFKKAKGKGYVALRCVQSIEDCTQPSLKFRVILGEGSAQTSRFVEHNFAEKQICNVPPPLQAPKGEEEWDFLNADAEKLTFVVVLEVQPQTA